MKCIEVKAAAGLASLRAPTATGVDPPSAATGGDPVRVIPDPARDGHRVESSNALTGFRRDDCGHRDETYEPGAPNYQQRIREPFGDADC